jgi:cyclin-dependent kinase regulatory subunit CKS1
MAPMGDISAVRWSILRDVHTLANKLQRALGPSETLQDFCTRHLESSQVQEYARAGMWPASRRVSIPYQDDKYKYVHIHLLPADLPKVQGKYLREPQWRALDPDGFPSIEGDGWEHYLKHKREPHVLLLRCLRQVGEGSSSMRVDASSQTESVPINTIASQTESVPVNSIASQTETVPAKSMALDEKLAELGLSPKLFIHQTPDVLALCQGIERVARAVEEHPLNMQAVAVARSCIILRGIRGALGIPWAAGYLVEDAHLFTKLTKVHPADMGKMASTFAESSLMGKLGKSLLDKHTREEHTSKTWASHREKRHVGMSGHQFLRALATVNGSRGAARMVLGLKRFTKRWLQQGGASPWTDTDTGQLLQIASGALPLRGGDGVEAYAAGYTAVSTGLGFMLWAMSSERMPVVSFEDESFLIIGKGQSATARAQMAAAGSNKAPYPYCFDPIGLIPSTFHLPPSTFYLLP